MTSEAKLVLQAQMKKDIFEFKGRIRDLVIENMLAKADEKHFVFVLSQGWDSYRQQEALVQTFSQYGFPTLIGVHKFIQNPSSTWSGPIPVGEIVDGVKPTSSFHPSVWPNHYRDQALASLKNANFSYGNFPQTKEQLAIVFQDLENFLAPGTETYENAIAFMKMRQSWQGHEDKPYVEEFKNINNTMRKTLLPTIKNIIQYTYNLKEARVVVEKTDKMIAAEKIAFEMLMTQYKGLLNVPNFEDILKEIELEYQNRNNVVETKDEIVATVDAQPSAQTEVKTAEVVAPKKSYLPAILAAGAVVAAIVMGNKE